MLNENKEIQSLNFGDLTSNREVQAAVAEVQARYMLAQHPNMKRSYEKVAVGVKELCSRKGFAEAATYHVNVGSKKNKTTGRWEDVFDDDLNIRAAEQLAIIYKNVSTNVVTVHEDPEKRKVAISVTDLECNITYNDEVTLYKTVERKKLKYNQEALAKRETSTAGEIVYIVACTPEELQKKQDAQVSKKIRKMFFRLFPVDLKILARETIDATLLSDIRENIKDRRISMLNAFKSLGIEPEEIEEYAGHKISKFNEEMILAMGKIYNGLKEGELRWSEVIDSKEGEDDNRAGEFDPNKDLEDVPDAKKPEKKEEETAPEPVETKPATKETPVEETETVQEPVEPATICSAHGPYDGVGACPDCVAEMTPPNDAGEGDNDEPETPKETKTKKTPAKITAKAEIVARITEKLTDVPDDMAREIEQEAQLFHKSLDSNDSLNGLNTKVLQKAEELIDQYLEENK